MEEAKEANKKAIRAWDFIERDLGAIRTIVAAKVEAGEVAVEPLVEVVFTPSPSAVLNG
jgi:methanogenic corrinoid protein MtbC1